MTQVGKVDSLTGLRFVAALWVVLLHFCSFDAAPGVPSTIAARAIGMGWSAVDLFFVLSGYILSKVYNQDPPVGATGYLRFLGFRLARIYPVHLVTSVIMLLLIPLECAVAHLTPDNAPYKLPAALAMVTLTQAWIPRAWYLVAANPPSWTISAEFFAYLLFPALLRCLKRQPGLARLFLAAGLALAPVSQIDLARPIFQFLLPQPLVSVASGFLIGMATFALQQRGSSLPFGRWSAAVAGLAIIGWATAPFTPSLLIGNLLFAWLIAALCRPDDRAGAVLGNPVMVYLGEISFALYLVHGLVHSGLDTLLLWAGWSVPGQLILSLYVMTSIFAAALLLELVEKPSRRALRAKIVRMTGGVPAPLTTSVA